MFLVTEEIVLVLVLLTLTMLYRYGSMTYAVGGYIFVQGIVNVYYPDILSKYLRTDLLNSENLLAMNSATSLLFLGVLAVFFLSLQKEGKERAVTALRWIVMLECVIVIWSKYIAKRSPWGLLLTSTMDGMFLGMTLPWMFSYRGKLIYLFRVLPIVTIFVTDSAIGEGAMVLSLVLMYSKQWRYLIVALGLAFTSILVNPNLFNDSKRVVAWIWTMKWWGANANHLFGTGIGTYWSLSYHVQKSMGVMNEGDALYTFLHNDWLQCLFELGILGLILVSAFYIQLLWVSRKNKVLLSSLVVYGACAFLNFPVRNIVSASYGMLLICLTKDKDSE